MKRLGMSVVSGRQGGFTLIELMFVVAVLGVLAAVALPTYADSQRRAHRGQAQSDLVEVAQGVERYYTINNTYDGATLEKIWGGTKSPKQGQAFYNLSLEVAEQGRAFTLTATPEASTGQVKDKCGTMTINSRGLKTPSSTEELECWRQ